ncbi:Uncharacterised protein [[Eubacterium] siraeum]|uniref:Uncharacterized protein n=1 Tax=[Eubacterium] siraeum TaxID=39492 RepID=A0A174ZM32_9FIRM|nr:Uncharacterised protein [[Eubacterium] siraeum]
MQQRNNIGIVVADCVQLINSSIVGVVHVLITLVTGSEAPAAVPVAVRLLPVAVAHLATLHRDTVGGDAAIGTLPVRKQMFHILRFHMVVAVAASCLIQFFPQRLYMMCHLPNFLIIHHLMEIIR